jgi:50S ribosomal subunit-associated GTPase HflX
MKLTRYHALKILQWCKDRYGVSEHNKGDLILSFRKQDAVSIELNEEAYYDAEDNEIFISSQHHFSIKELCSSVIEEYQHYLQSNREYQKLAKHHDYDTHPLEVAAKRVAERDCEICSKEMRQKHQKFNGIP